ncbi:MAG: nuclear transport factor 2 family protein [Nitrosarchaeum sp.]|nr:nuclear transport factor 2 family protein [Nitrosarchaeum sp.]
MIKENDVVKWMEEFRNAWVNKDKDRVLSLFSETKNYYERPFKSATTKEEIQSYWNDIDNLTDITLDYEIYAIENDVACIHWVNKYTYQEKRYHLDGVFMIKFDEFKNCIEFRQWWFME